MTRRLALFAVVPAVLVLSLHVVAGQAPDPSNTTAAGQGFSLASQFAAAADQNRGPIPDEGYAGLGVAIRQLQNVGVFMDAVAHPDDENNGLLVMLNRGYGIRTVLVTATRGDGGQNEIGPELGDALGVLRTAELMSMHKIDGTEQYFCRAVDFGYSFSLEETFNKWGKEEILSDFVRHIRTVRPDVIIAMSPQGTGGGQHHQASALLVGEAFKAAADPARFPEQLKEGLLPWQSRKLYYSQGFGGGAQATGKPADPSILPVDNEVYDRLIGNTFSFLGSLARSNHKSQGMAQLLALPGTRGFGSFVTYRLADTAPAAANKNASLFDGVDTTIPGLAQYVHGTPPAALTEGLKGVADAAAAAATALSGQGAVAAVAPLVEGLSRVRALRGSIGALAIDATARYEIDSRLAIKEKQFENAVLIAEGMQFDVLADDGVVFPGQQVKFSPDGLIIANRGSDSIDFREVAFEGLTGDPGCKPRALPARTVYRCQPTLTVAADVPFSTPYWHRLPDAARYEFDPGVPFGVPFRPTPFNVRLTFVVRGADVHVTLPVRHRYEGNVFSGEKRMELKVVPALSVQTTPSIVIVPSSPNAPRATSASASRRVSPERASDTSASRRAAQREVRVSVTNDTRGGADAEVLVEVPKGWQVNPPSAKLSFTQEDEVQTARFTLTPLTGTPTGAYRMRAVARAFGKEFDQGFQVVEYQHIERHQLMRPANLTVKLIDVKVRPNLLVGYVMGVGDQVPEALEQLGARVDFLTSDDLAWGNLSRYDVIVTGVRAYERREDLRQHNQRLLDYVKNGGTMIVQYNKMEFNQAQYGPYPAKVSNNRITDENAPVQVLQPQSPIFNAPNRIGPAAWQGWVQERGLYFLGEKDPRYVDLVQMEDPFPYNAGMKRGALVEATYGKGVWVYVGLGLWRQLPAGTDGAYQLFANLISLKGTGKSAQ